MATVNDRGPTLSERAVGQLRRAIVLGELEAGERYSATELGERFGMSRTPIREATQELARRAASAATPEQRAEIAAQFAHFVEVAESGDVDATLRCDRDFHRGLLEVAGNVRAVEVLTEQRNMVLKTGVGTVPHMRSTVECAEDHRAIVDAVASGDGEAAGAAMRSHILNTAELLLRQESASRADFGAPDALVALERLV